MFKISYLLILYLSFLVFLAINMNLDKKEEKITVCLNSSGQLVHPQSYGLRERTLLANEMGLSFSVPNEPYSELIQESMLEKYGIPRSYYLNDKNAKKHDITCNKEMRVIWEMDWKNFFGGVSLGIFFLLIIELFRRLIATIQKKLQDKKDRNRIDE
jgi:hypothetical protein